MKIVIIIVLVVAVLLGVAFYFIAPRLFKSAPKQNNQPVNLVVWGLWEEENILKSAFEGYKKLHPNVTITYKRQTSVNYNSRVQAQVVQGVAGERPDIFMMHNSWLPMYLKSGSVAAMPETVMSLADYSKTFYPVMTESLTKGGKVYGVARGVDGLVMFYNEDILRAAGVTAVPQSWPELEADAVKTTVNDDKGKIKSAGVALGTTNNVDHWSDILGLLFLEQNGASLEKPDAASNTTVSSFPGGEVLKFYTKFVIDPKTRVWDQTMDPSTQSFAQGRLAFYFAPSWRAQDLKAMNPNLKFKTAPVPQLPGKTVGWASFWAYGVASKSTNQDVAWDFLKYLTTADVERQLYQDATAVRPLGIPYSRMDMQSLLSGDPLAGAVVNQGQYFKYWYLSSQTFDQGINDEMIKYYEDAVNATLAGTDPVQALHTTTLGVQQVLVKYGLATPAPSVDANSTR